MKSLKNRRKKSFLDSIPTVSLENVDDKTASRCKFNFGFMDFTQTAGQKFNQWNKDQLTKLLDKLVSYCKEPLSHWQKERCGRHGHVLEIYGGFPVKSDFVHPKHIPHQVRWGRFRVDQKTRLAGFVIPDEFDQKKQGNSDFLFDCNTFYIVFLDKDYKFYKV